MALLRRSQRHRDELGTRARQQAAIAEFGQRALEGVELQDLLEEAVEVAMRELRTDYVAVLELTGDREGLLVRAGLGLPDGMLGGVLLADEETVVDYAVQAAGPVVVSDLEAEDRFDTSAARRALGVVSGISAPIGARGRYMGALAAGSRTAQQFSPHDANFLMAIANTVGPAAERARTEDRVRDSEALFRELADTTPALMWTTDAEGH